MNYAYEFKIDQNLYEEQSNYNDYNNFNDININNNNANNITNNITYQLLLGFRGIIFFMFIHNYFRENLFYTLTLRYLKHQAYTASMYIINDVIYPLYICGTTINGENETEDITDSEDAKETTIKKNERYEDKYIDKFKKMESVELSTERLDSLKNTILFENTPNGNVVMFYDNSRGSFAYYTDNTIPYRFLEVIARKYVIVNNCKSIYVDMEFELQEAERKINEKKQKKEEKEEEEKQKREEGKQQSVDQPKNVFAKFKSYNKDSSIQSAGIPVDSKSHTPKTAQQDVEKIVKDNANRYSCEGKIANFNFLKKVDRKVVDKRYGTSFADFKKSLMKV